MLFERSARPYLLIFLLSIISVSCDQDGETIDETPSVYVSGIVIADGKLVTAYWKNGKLVKTFGEVAPGVPSSIYVSDGDVYLAGSSPEKLYAPDGNHRIILTPVYWKNGEINRITDGLEYGNASSIVVKGSDVYVSGTGLREGTYVAKYWKNGIAEELSDGSRDGFANSIYVSEEGDVYVGGSQSQPSGNPQAVYWKNGVPTSLTGADTISAIRDLAVHNGTVYAVGYAKLASLYTPFLATLWKNTVEETLSSSEYPDATGVFVSEAGEVYVSGFESEGNFQGARYWVNGNETILTNEEVNSGFATDIFVLGTDVYTCGYENGVFKYWKNQVGTALDNRLEVYEINSIFVDP